jgi:DNA polymerase II large subunit
MNINTKYLRITLFTNCYAVGKLSLITHSEEIENFIFRYEDVQISSSYIAYKHIQYHDTHIYSANFITNNNNQSSIIR